MSTDKKFRDEERALLESFKAMLEGEGFSPLLREVSDQEQLPVAALYLPFHPDDNLSPVIEIRAERQMGLRNESSIVAVQFLVHFSEEVAAGSVLDIALFLATINRHLPLPGFEFDMGTHQLYFRYVLYNSEASIDGMVLKSLVGAIIYTVGSYLPALQLLAGGQQRYHQLMEEVAVAIAKSGE